MRVSPARNLGLYFLTLAILSLWNGTTNPKVGIEVNLPTSLLYAVVYVSLANNHSPYIYCSPLFAYPSRYPPQELPV